MRFLPQPPPSFFILLASRLLNIYNDWPFVFLGHLNLGGTLAYGWSGLGVSTNVWTFQCFCGNLKQFLHVHSLITALATSLAFLF